MHYIQANTNGRLHPADEPSIAPLNRGFLYGDAIYEVWRTYHGVVFAWKEHWARLEASARALHMDTGLTADAVLGEIRRTVAAYRTRSPGAAELYIRLQVTRGEGQIGLDTTLAGEATFVILVQPCPALEPSKAAGGLWLSVARDLRRNPVESLNPRWKTGNYLNNLLCLREARARGADEVVMLNLSGAVTECAVSNIGFVRDGRVLTPPMESGILGGITRGLVLGRVASSAGLVAVEAPVRVEDLGSMQECFVMSTTKDVVPVRGIDGFSYATGPGTVAERLKRAFAAEAEAYARDHPELAV